MACLNKTAKRVFLIVLTLLLLCITLSSSVLAENIHLNADNSAESIIIVTETPSFDSNNNVACGSWGVFDKQTMTISELYEHTAIDKYVALFDGKENIQKVVVLKNGELQASGYLENDMTVRIYQNENDYLDYTIIDMKPIPKAPDSLTVSPTNTRAVTNPYNFTLPLDNMNLTSHISSSFGSRIDPITGAPNDDHNGIDIFWDGIYGTPIKAVYGGTASVVQAAEDTTDYGCHVVINHGLVNGEYLKTVYAHMASSKITNGQTVTQGQEIGYVGDTGRVNREHLHFEVRVGAADSMWSCTPVDPVPYLIGAGNATNPVGNYESATGGGGTVTVKGWAFDNDDTSASINIHVYIGGPAGSTNAIGYNIGATTVTRSDVNNTHNITGAHGFEKKIVTSKRGSQEVYVYAINIGDGTNTLLGYKTVTITGNPVGSYDGASATAGTVRVYGWAFDYDEPSTALRIHVYIGGPAGSSNAIGYSVGNTSIERSDVNSLYNITGKHGFDFTITTSKRGSQDVYVYAINVGEGSNKLLGHKNVTITGNPVGEFESATGGIGTVTVKGWAFDYDDPSASIKIHVYIGGPAGSSDAIGYSLGATDIMRNEVNSKFEIAGAHGFERTITTTMCGTQEVYVYAINTGEGTHTLLGHKTVTIT